MYFSVIQRETYYVGEVSKLPGAWHYSRPERSEGETPFAPEHLADIMQKTARLVVWERDTDHPRGRGLSCTFGKSAMLEVLVAFLLGVLFAAGAAVLGVVAWVYAQPVVGVNSPEMGAYVEPRLPDVRPHWFDQPYLRYLTSVQVHPCAYNVHPRHS